MRPYNLPLAFWTLAESVAKNKLASGLLNKAYFLSLKGPRSAKIHITSDCNYDCRYCYSDKNRPSMAFDLITELIDQLARMNLKTLELTGGEPFLNKELSKILSYAKDKGLQTTIFSNGSLIDEQWASKLENTIVSIKYDCTTKYQAKNKTAITPKTIDRNIRLLVNHGVPVVAFITVSKDMVPHLKDVINSALSLGAFPAIERYIPVKSDKENNQMSISKEDWNYALSLINKVYDPYQHLIDCVSALQGGPCSCYTTQFSIMQDGNVLPCQFLPISESIGNVHHESIKTIWNRFEERRKTWKTLAKKCQTCSIKRICNGGCNTHAYYCQGDYDSGDPLCGSGMVMTYGQCPFIVIHSMKKPSNDRLITL